MIKFCVQVLFSVWEEDGQVETEILNTDYICSNLEYPFDEEIGEFMPLMKELKSEAITRFRVEGGEFVQVFAKGTLSFNRDYFGEVDCDTDIDYISSSSVEESLAKWIGGIDD